MAGSRDLLTTTPETPITRQTRQLIRDRIHVEIHIALADRQKVLRDLSDLTRYGIDWDSDVG